MSTGVLKSLFSPSVKLSPNKSCINISVIVSEGKNDIFLSFTLLLNYCSVLSFFQRL